MGNHQTNGRRQHRVSESVGFGSQESDDGRFVTLNKRQRRISTKSAPPLHETNITIYPPNYSLVAFSIPALPNDIDATITGTFTDWSERNMIKSNDRFKIEIEIPHGPHYYKILVDGQQRFTLDEKIKFHKNYGPVHFLDVNENNNQNVNNSWKVMISPFDKLEISEKDIDNQSIKFDQTSPPRISPHLLNILLNKKMPDHCEPDVLPEPNSVMLGHLYALSIQNGIMILSTTNRYKQKFVTTCFYKPN